jgi:5'-nucleotidase / UDP-sugar diphosphatase
MKYATFCLPMIAAAFYVAGCGDNKPASSAAVGTDLRQSGQPPLQPIQPVQPVQPVSDTAPVVTTVASATPAITGSSYTIQKGDTLFKIARAKYGDASAVRKIKEANPGLDADHIKVGQKINLP